MLNVDDLLWLEYKRVNGMRMDRYDMGDGTSEWICWECGEVIEDDDQGCMNEECECCKCVEDDEEEA